MKLKKVITIIIILIIVLNTLIPTIALATNETNNEVFDKVLVKEDW